MNQNQLFTIEKHQQRTENLVADIVLPDKVS